MVVGVAEAGQRPVGRQRQTRPAAAIEKVLDAVDGFRTVQEIHDETPASTSMSVRPRSTGTWVCSLTRPRRRRPSR